MKPPIPLCCNPPAYSLMTKQAAAIHSPDAFLEGAVAIAMPADGPSLGIAPAGTWTWTSRSNSLSGIDSHPACARANVHAARADSFITSPSWPVRISSPLPRINDASTNMMSPPAGV